MTDNTKIGRIPLSKISVNQKFNSDLYYKDFLLHPQDISFTEEDLQLLRLWKVHELESCELESHNSLAESLEEPDVAISALSDSLSIMQDDIANIQQAQELHQEICDFAARCYQIVNKQLRFPVGEPLRTVKQLISRIRQMGFSILRFPEFQAKGDYIEIHSANSFILSIALANEAKIPQYRLLNLALSALFCEVGLTKFVGIDQDKRLTPQELQLQRDHVQEGLKLLQPYSFPKDVVEAIQQHHERLDGSGYPDGISQGEISNFARYLGLIGDYVTMTTDSSPSESRSAHTAILTILKGAKRHYDPYLVRLLVQLLSLYPVGTYVSLSNGLIGRVLRNNPEDPRLPVIQVLLDQDHKPVVSSTVIQTNKNISVSQPMPYKEIAPIIAELQRENSRS